jgi:ribosome-associated protein
LRLSKKDRQIREKAIKILTFALNKKARRGVILDLRKVSNLCDYFIICSGESPRQVRSIYDEVIRLSKKENIEIHHVEDDSNSYWLLIDFFDMVLHIFLEEARDFYDIEHLWKGAKRVRLPKNL